MVACNGVVAHNGVGCGWHMQVVKGSSGTERAVAVGWRVGVWDIWPGQVGRTAMGGNNSNGEGMDEGDRPGTETEAVGS